MRYFWLLALLLTVACSNNSTIKATPASGSEPTREELKNAMYYHGILFAQEDKNGEWYFLRGGKRCRLFAHVQSLEK